MFNPVDTLIGNAGLVSNFNLAVYISLTVVPNSSIPLAGISDESSEAFGLYTISPNPTSRKSLLKIPFCIDPTVCSLLNVSLSFISVA